MIAEPVAAAKPRGLPWAGLPAGLSARGRGARLRALALGALALALLALLLQSWRDERFETRLALTNDGLARTAEHRAAALHLQLLALSLLHDTEAATAAGRALALKARLQDLAAPGDGAAWAHDTAAHAGQALDTWRAAHQRLQARGLHLQQRLQATPPADWQAAAVELQAEAAQAAAAAQALLVPGQRDAAQQRAAHAEQRQQLAAAALALTALALLAGLLALRAIRRDAAPVAMAAAPRGAVADTRPLPADRSAVVLRLQRSLAHAARHPGYGFALLSIDIDRPDPADPTDPPPGAAAAEELRQQIAGRLQRALRPGDVLGRHAAPDAGLCGPLVAHEGAEGWLVVLDGVNRADRVAAVTERLLHELAEPYVVGFAPLKRSVSIGAVLHLATARQADGGEGEGDDHTAPALRDTDADADALLLQADTARLDARRAGRGRWALYDGALAERVGRTLALEAELGRALAGDELFVVYQPWLDLHSHAVAGVEALLRWRHPQRGVLLPAEFMAVAESSGLLQAVGDRLLGLACTQFVQWQAELGDLAPLRLAVNLTPAQLHQPALAASIAAVLQASGMQARWLQIEVTESPPVQGLASAAPVSTPAALGALRALGVSLALDDFGTGYASLARLHQLPVDTVKIDRSLVAQAGAVDHHRVLVESIIRMAHTLGLRTVADGVETEAQAALMSALHCQQGQGGLYAPALEATALAAWLHAQALQHA